MHEQFTALADAARWRIVEILAERPRSVGVVGEFTGLRQPQASKHLQTLERSGLVVSCKSGQRRSYAGSRGAIGRAEGHQSQRERLFDEGLPATTWELSSNVTSESGVIALTYDRARSDG